MSKAIILILGLVACTFAATSFEQVKQLIERDECGLHGMETIRPKIENKLEELKTVKIILYLEPQRFQS